MVLPENVGRYAYRQGLFVLAQNGEIVEIRNDASFNSKSGEWLAVIGVNRGNMVIGNQNKVSYTHDEAGPSVERLRQETNQQK